MSNLGLYQVMTSLAKKVGGPAQLSLIIAAGGYLVIRPVEAVGKMAIKKGISRIRIHKYSDAIFTINSNAIDNQGLEFKKASEFRVLEIDNDAVLVEIIGDNNNPYFVSKSFLHTISDFK